MKRRQLRNGTTITELGFGAAQLGNLYRETTDAESSDAVNAAWDAGVRYFDTAPHYGLGLSERRLAQALRERPRDEYLISTKVGRILEPNPDGADQIDEAFVVHAYATLAAQVHENHLYAAIPLLVIAAAGRPRYRPLLWVLTAIFALNLNVFYGISEYEWRGAFTFPRSMTVLDITVWLSLANCAELVWHARTLKRETS